MFLEKDKLLKIKTSGRDDSNADQYRYPYEPTPYSVLERLANSGYIRKKNVILDYGCGKGRVDFFDFCVGPKSFEGVEFTDFVVEDVYDYACIVHKDPACGSIAFNSLGCNSVLVAESEIDIVGKGLDVAFVGCGSNYKIIAKAADFADFKYAKSDCFFAVKDFCDFKCKFSGFH